MADKWDFVIGFRKGSFSVMYYTQERECDNDHYKIITSSAHWSKNKVFDNITEANTYYELEILWIKSLFQKEFH